jgi:DNA-binding CsgD family transcriptional regulator
LKRAEDTKSALALFEQKGFGFAAANADRIVTFAIGNLAEYLPIGTPLCSTFAPLRGLQGKIEALPRANAGSRITIPSVAIVKDAHADEKTSLLITWDNEAKSYSVCSYPAHDEAERRLTATLRLKRISEEILRAGGLGADNGGARQGAKGPTAAHILDSLTPRERQVVSLLASGRTNKGVARMLDLSTKTVEAHRARALKRLNVKTTAELIRLVIESGFSRSDS